jgi:hypothetical protein
LLTSIGFSYLTRDSRGGLTSAIFLFKLLKYYIHILCNNCFIRL